MSFSHAETVVFLTFRISPSSFCVNALFVRNSCKFLPKLFILQNSTCNLPKLRKKDIFFSKQKSSALVYYFPNIRLQIANISVALQVVFALMLFLSSIL